MKNKLYKGLLLGFLAVLGACETTELDLLDNPNTAAPDAANVPLLLNGAMNNFGGLTATMINRPMQVTRMIHMYGPTYDNGVRPENFNGIWSSAYAGVMADTKIVIDLGTEQGFTHHVAVAQILQSFTMTTMVDFFGDVPYSEAIGFEENFNPGLDDDAEVYAAALALLDNAIVHLTAPAGVSLTPADDYFYGGSTANWITLAKTLKLRIYNNTRLVDPAAASAINALIADGDLIDEADEDFQFSYGTKDNDPDVRHYKFTAGYLGDGGEYMSNSFMDRMKNKHDNVDPRLHYYFYRQTLTYPDPSTPEGLFTLPCMAQSKPLHYGFADVFCADGVGEGYWGRDHMNNDGGPPDGNQITVFGIYPAGGKQDDGSGSAVKKSDGAKGAGITPIWNVANTKFVLAEAAAELSTTGDARTLLEEGMRASITKATTFAGATPPDAADVDAYVNEILGDYDDASEDGKLDIIMTEAYIAGWGNGLEAFNGYRRTGYPSGMQPSITSTPGAFTRSFPYPANAVARNQNISAKPNNEVQVFWDTNPAGFID